MSSRTFSVRFAFTLLLTTLLLAVAAQAQSTATLRGAVTDTSGAVVPSASIVLQNLQTGEQRTTTSDSVGVYQLTSLPVGKYKLEVQAPGFQKQTMNDLVLEVGRTAVQNVRLQVGTVNQEVVVTAENPVIDASTMTVGQVIGEHVVQEIPLNGRHFVDLGLLIPGTVTPPQNGFLTAPLRGQGSFAINTAGYREDMTNFMINGINLNDMVQNQITFQPSIDTVQQFKVDNQTYSAEYGRNAGAIVNIATRSGTNEFHGEGFEFLRNDAVDARNFFSIKKNPFKRNQFGGALGGPIRKDKTFFFISYEGLRQRQGLPFSSLVPSDAQRGTVTDPAVSKLLAVLPHATSVDPVTGNGQFVGSGVAPVDIDQGTADISHVLGENDRLNGYYVFQRDHRQETASGTTIPGFGDTRDGHRQILTLSETHTFGPSVVNDVRLGFNRIHLTFMPNALLDPTAFNIGDGVSGAVGLPRISVSGGALLFGGPLFEPQGRGDTTVVVADNVSWLKGKHSLKFGTEVRRFHNNNFGQTPGTFTFTSMPSFLSGQASSFSASPGSSPSRISTGALGFFAEDSYKVAPSLTLELGLRWDWNMSPTEAKDRFVNFDPTTVSLVTVHDAYHQNDKNFQPRLGFAWNILGDNKTVLRGGYGLSTDQPVTNALLGLTTNPPLSNPVSVNASATTLINFANAFTQAAAPGNLAPSALNSDFRNAYLQSWNLNIQRQVTPNTGVMIGYFGSKGTHLRVNRNLNQFVNGVRPFAVLSTTSPIDPNAKLGNIFYTDTASNSSYNALWITADQRLWHGLQFNASYTFSKSIDENSLTSSGLFDVQDSYNIRGDRGLSDFDARQRFVIDWIYQLPFKGNRVVSGWQLASIVQLQSGNPITVLANSPSKGNIASLTGVATIRPDLIGPVHILDSFAPAGTAPRVLWMTNTLCDPTATCPANAAFALPVNASGTLFHFGDLARNSIIGPGFKNVDFSVQKDTKVSERVTAEFRADMFDLFNHANFGQPNSVAGSSLFGLITSTRFPPGDSGSSRQIQFALKMIF